MSLTRSLSRRLSRVGLRSLIKGLPGVRTFDMPVISRMPVSGAYYLKGDQTTTGSVTTLLTANANVATIGTSVVSDAIANSVTTFGWQTTGAITGKGALIYFCGSTAIPDSILQSIVIETSTNSTNWIDGVWTPVPFTPVKPSGEPSVVSMLTRGQIAKLPAGPQCKVRVKFTKDNNTSARTIRAGLYQRPAVGVPDDIVLLSGPSLMSPHMVTDMRTSLRTINTQRDPLIVNMGRAGAVAADVVTETVIGGLAAYPDAATMVLDIGGNDISNNRPGPGEQMHLPNALSTVLSTLLNYPNCQLYLGSVTWRNYPAPNAVNDLLNPENGSKPYNDNQVGPWIEENTPWAWDDELGIWHLDTYSTLLYYGPTYMNGDGIHLLSTGNAQYRLELVVEAILDRVDPANDWTRDGFVQRTLSGHEVAGTITANNKLRLQACITQWPPAQKAAHTTARNALVTRLNAIAVSG